MEMDFTFKAYEKLICELSKNNYSVAGYHDCDQFDKCVILRHDVDIDVGKALEFAEFEHSIGVKDSTYFFLITSDFYNIASAKNRAALRKIAEMGFEIGLHFDETSYPEQDDIHTAVYREAALMQDILAVDIKSVSMHIPSEKTLRSDYKFDGLINSYSKKFFGEYKYLSDSRMYWREDVFGAVRSGQYRKLHILTHPFWYHENGRSDRDIIYSFVNSAKIRYYDTLDKNYRNLEEVLRKDEI